MINEGRIEMRTPAQIAHEIWDNSCDESGDELCVAIAEAIEQERQHQAKLEAEVAEMQVLFDLQHSRVGEAEKLWQLAHKEPHTKPDLGKLVEWLCLRADGAILQLSQAEARLASINLTLEGYKVLAGLSDPDHRKIFGLVEKRINDLQDENARLKKLMGRS